MKTTNKDIVFSIVVILWLVFAFILEPYLVHLVGMITMIVLILFKRNVKFNNWLENESR